MRRVRDIPPVVGSVLVAFIAALSTVIPIVVVAGHSSSPPIPPDCHACPSGVTTTTKQEIIESVTSAAERRSRSVCVEAIRAMPLRILRMVPPADLREMVASCSAPFLPPVKEDRPP